MGYINIKDGLSSRQVERQKIREKGKYSKYPRCELCGKMVVSGEHYSDPRCNVTGIGLILHKRCCQKSEKMNNKKFIETFGKDFTLMQKMDYTGRLNREFSKRI